MKKLGRLFDYLLPVSQVIFVKRELWQKSLKGKVSFASDKRI